MRRSFVAFVLGAVLGCGGASAASAFPTLQLTIPGASYDPVEESWVATSSPFELWVIGKSPVGGVKLAFAFTSGETGSITLTPTTAGDFDGVPGDDDPSLPAGGVQAKSEASASADGAIPLLGDGSALPPHGVYGPGVSFLEFDLGDFTLTDSPIGDYQGTPTSFPGVGQINAYTVSVTGFASGVHLDAYGIGVNGGGKLMGVSTPSSHDAEALPEPALLLLLGAGLLAPARRR